MRSEWCGCFPSCRNRPKRRCWESSCSVRERLIGANYREAFRGRSKAEFVAKCGDCLREVEESAYWLELLVVAGIVPAAKLEPLRKEADELTAIFVTILKRSKGL